MTARLNVTLREVSVRRGAAWVLRDISLDFKAGERWALVGGNGAGKTQFLKLFCPDVWPTPTGREARVYRVGRRPVDLIRAKQRIAYVGAELQDKYARYGWDLAVADLIATGLHRTDLLLGPVSAAQRRRVARMLALCGLKRLATRRFLSLSYGQQRIALLARGLVRSPDWLLLDEFYNGLDANHRRRVDAILAHAARRGQSWIAAAHRAMDVPRGTRGLIELCAGRLAGVTRLTAANLKALSAEAAEPPAGQHAAHRAAGNRRGSGVRRGRGALLLRITAADLYVEHHAVLRDVNWELRRGDQWAVFGANGAGKSSFLKLLYGDLSPAWGGAIERSGFPPGTSVAAWKRQVGYVSPELQTVYAVDVTLLELVASGRYASIGLCDEPTALDLRLARRWLEFFGMSSLAQRRPRELSYGQLRRALFARALVGEPRLLLLDEPLTGLDPAQRASMKRFLERLMRQHRTLVIAVHHPEDLPNGMNRALHLSGQRAVATDLHFATSVSGRTRHER